jgi:hypothetical protein
MKKINFIKKMFVFLAACLIGKNMQAQTNLKIVPEPVSNTADLPINTIPTDNNTSNINSSRANTANEAIPTPEEQGFVKLESNGRHTYIKKVGDIIIEFKPE